MLRWLWLSVIVIVLDQATKYLASSQLQFHVPVPVMPSFNWFLSHNTGAAFSFLSDAGGWQRWFFIGLAAVVAVIIVSWLKKLEGQQAWLAAALSLILGGAIGNVIDRIYHGYVIDFIQWYYESYYWPSFNIADTAISVGAAILIIDGLFGSKGKKQSS
jgi:signal peptidase II